jgi:pimeloyl-ACP methyl ester carboxylesterase
MHQGNGPDLVLLHGLSGSGRWWRHTIPALTPHFTTHSPDLVGFGLSRGKPQPGVPEMADIVVKWLHATGITRAHIIGHSMGGQIAIHIAARHKEVLDRLVLVAAAGVPRERTLQQAARFMTEIVPPRAWGAKTFLPRVAIDALRAGPRVMLYATAHLMRDDIRPLLPLISAPTLAIWGRLDPLTPLHDGEYIAANIPGAALSVFENAAHMPMIDEPARFNAEVLAFLKND